MDNYYKSFQPDITGPIVSSRRKRLSKSKSRNNYHSLTYSSETSTDCTNNTSRNKPWSLQITSHLENAQRDSQPSADKSLPSGSGWTTYLQHPIISITQHHFLSSDSNDDSNPQSQTNVAHPDYIRSVNCLLPKLTCPNEPCRILSDFRARPWPMKLNPSEALRVSFHRHIDLINDLEPNPDDEELQKTKDDHFS